LCATRLRLTTRSASSLAELARSASLVAREHGQRTWARCRASNEANPPPLVERAAVDQHLATQPLLRVDVAPAIASGRGGGEAALGVLAPRLERFDGAHRELFAVAVGVRAQGG